MTLAQDKAHPLVANRLTVHWPNTDAQNLILTLEGLEMNMGSAKFLYPPTVMAYTVPTLFCPFVLRMR